jgi:hypothetical protein
MPEMRYWTLDPPARWQAGSGGAEKTPFYFDCADCGAKEPPIAGIISNDGTFTGIGLLGGDRAPFVRPAMFCAPCMAVRLAAHQTQAVTSIDELADAMRKEKG